MKRITAIFLILIISNCSAPKKPDFARLYCLENHNHAAASVPLILIHGFRGSKLRDIYSKKEVWYGDMQKVLFSSYHDLSVKINPETLQPDQTQLEAYDIIGKAGTSDFYSALIETLQNYGHYQYTQAGEPVSGEHRRVYVFTYDWRQDNVKNALRLHQYIQQLKKDHNNPGLKVDIIAHSMGGLISRYYLRYGNKDVLENKDYTPDYSGAGNIRKTIIVGTPNSGSAVALESFINGLRVGLRNIPTDVLATMPSVYQLFPNASDDWLIDIYGNPVKLDIFNIKTWKLLKWSVFNEKMRKHIVRNFDSEQQGKKRLATLEQFFIRQLDRSRRFADALSVPVKNPPYSIIAMGGDCQHTPSRLLVEEINGVYYARSRPENIENPLPGTDYQKLLMQPGDSSVTKQSLLATHAGTDSLPLNHSYFTCEKHESLLSNLNLQDNLLHILLSH